jgi:hypothetical protein
LVFIIGFAGILILSGYWLTRDTNRQMLDRLNAKCTTCEKAKQVATTDFQAGHFYLVHFGMPENKSVQRAKLFEDRFNIETIAAGCGSSKEIDCYNDQMIQLLSDKFGADTLEKTFQLK